MIERQKRQSAASEVGAGYWSSASCERCRRKYLLEYFGDELAGQRRGWRRDRTSCGGCDVCLAELEDFDATVISQKILSAVVRTGERFGAGYIAQVLRGAKTERVLRLGHDKLSVYGVVDDFSDGDIREFCGMLLEKGLLHKNSAEYATLGVTQEGRSFLNSRESLTLSRPKKQDTESERRSSPKRAHDTLDYDSALFEKLRALRRGIAAENGVPPYIVFGDATLQQMAHYIPQNLNSLSHISGVGAVKLKQYGDDFLAVICEYARENNLPERPIRPQRQSRQRGESRSVRIAGSTYDQTKRLLAQGLSIEQVAQERDMSPSTIFAHVEMLVQTGENLDLRAHLPSPDRAMRVQDAFHEVGDNRLTPVKELLGDDYSYEEIRLVRAFMHQQAMEKADESKSHDVEQIRQEYPSAYEKWTAEEDNELNRLNNMGLSVSELAERFGRQPSAIRSRLRKLSTDD